MGSVSNRTIPLPYVWRCIFWKNEHWWKLRINSNSKKAYSVFLLCARFNPHYSFDHVCLWLSTLDQLSSIIIASLGTTLLVTLCAPSKRMSYQREVRFNREQVVVLQVLPVEVVEATQHLPTDQVTQHHLRTTKTTKTTHRGSRLRTRRLQMLILEGKVSIY